MNKKIINKDLTNYLNSDIFITDLYIPLFEIATQSSFLSEDEHLSTIKERLETLLILPHQEFWCHVLFDDSILRSLQSFLSKAKRPHELLLDDIVLSSTERHIYRLYYRLVLRLTTYKESHIVEFSQANFGQLIYDNYIIDVPTMFDICSIFGEDNCDLISKSMCGIVASQRLYINDISDYIRNTIKLINDKVQSAMTNSATSTNATIKAKVNQHLLSKCSPGTDEIVDMLYYVFDFGRNWSVFLDCVKTQTEIMELITTTQLHKTFELLFDKIVPHAQHQINKFETKEPERIKKLLSFVCYYLIKCWRTIFTTVFLDKFENDTSRTSEENYALIVECIAMISGCQDNSIFADALYLVHPLQSDLNVIFAAIKNDKQEYYSDYANDALQEILNRITSRKTLFSHIDSNTGPLSRAMLNTVTNNAADNSDISPILDIFPELSAQDIHAYMKSYNCASDCMLESLLEGAIDVSFVKELSTQLTNEQNLANTESVMLRDSILQNHRNIYDGDELDTGRVKASQIHQGKRQVDLNPIVDSSLRNLILGIVERQGDEDEEERLRDNENNVYNDEFDDVYGVGHDIVINERGAEEEIEEHKVTPFGRSQKDTSMKAPLRAHRIGQINGVSQPAAKEEVEPIIMEPSALRYSQHTKNQAKKKRFADHGQHGASSGGAYNHRQGSHAAPTNETHKKDHRPKGARNNDNQ